MTKPKQKKKSFTIEELSTIRDLFNHLTTIPVCPNCKGEAFTLTYDNRGILFSCPCGFKAISADGTWENLATIPFTPIANRFKGENPAYKSWGQPKKKPKEEDEEDEDPPTPDDELEQEQPMSIEPKEEF